MSSKFSPLIQQVIDSLPVELKPFPQQLYNVLLELDKVPRFRLAFHKDEDLLYVEVGIHQFSLDQNSRTVDYRFYPASKSIQSGKIIQVLGDGSEKEMPAQTMINLIQRLSLRLEKKKKHKQEKNPTSLSVRALANAFLPVDSRYCPEELVKMLEQYKLDPSWTLNGIRGQSFNPARDRKSVV